MSVRRALRLVTGRFGICAFRTHAKGQRDRTSRFFLAEDDDVLDQMGLVAAFSTHANPGSVARALGKGANRTALPPGQAFVGRRNDPPQGSSRLGEADEHLRVQRSADPFFPHSAKANWTFERVTSQTRSGALRSRKPLRASAPMKLTLAGMGHDTTGSFSAGVSCLNPFPYLPYP